MTLRQIFFNEVARIRIGLLLLLFVFAFLTITLLLAAGLRIFYAIGHEYFPHTSHGAFIADVIYRLTLLLSALGAGYVCTRVVEGLPWRALGLTFHVHWLRDLVIGSAVGIASLSLAAAIATAAGGLCFTVIGTTK